MATYSVVAHDGQMYGPVDEQTLAEWVRQGRVNAQSVLHCHQNSARYAAGSIPALQPALGLSQQQVSQLLQPSPVAYATPAPYRAVPAQHALTPFPTPLAVLLSIFVPLFAIIYYGMIHGNLPQRRPDDPSAGKAIGFMFIPFFSMYWVCFFWVRLCTRINDERARVGLAPTAPRALVIATLWCFLGLFIPILNILVLVGILVMLLICLIQIQGSINELCAATGRT